jgi:proteic killer suppression protein
VRFVFASKALELLYTASEGSEKFPEEVVTAFLRRVRHIEAAKDERDLRSPPSVHYEQLKGKRYAGKASLRLNRQWRLILSVEGDTQEKYVLIHEMTNHYGD